MSQKAYLLEQRTTIFAENILSLVKKIVPTLSNQPIISQLVRSATSIGANYHEANNAISKKDFRNKIYICQKEANETKYWLRLLAKTNPELINECRKFWQEAKEFTLIFSKANSTMKKSLKLNGN